MSLIDGPPAGWGDDALSAFIESTWNNVLATFQKMPTHYEELRRLDGEFCKAAEHLRNPSNPLSATMLLRCHSAHRAALRLALSGQLPESYALLRVSLENALYSFGVAENPDTADVWFARHESETGRKRVREAFGIRRLLSAIEGKDAGLARAVRNLYERTIDLGAHPNERAIMTNMTHRQTETADVFDSNYYCGLDSIWGRGCLKTCAEVAVASLKIYELIFPEKFRLLGLSESLARFR